MTPPRLTLKTTGTFPSKINQTNPPKTNPTQSDGAVDKGKDSVQGSERFISKSSPTSFATKLFSSEKTSSSTEIDSQALLAEIMQKKPELLIVSHISQSIAKYRAETDLTQKFYWRYEAIEGAEAIYNADPTEKNLMALFEVYRCVELDFTTLKAHKEAIDAEVQKPLLDALSGTRPAPATFADKTPPSDPLALQRKSSVSQDGGALYLAQKQIDVKDRILKLIDKVHAQKDDAYQRTIHLGLAHALMGEPTEAMNQFDAACREFDELLIDEDGDAETLAAHITLLHRMFTLVLTDRALPGVKERRQEILERSEELIARLPESKSKDALFLENLEMRRDFKLRGIEAKLHHEKLDSNAKKTDPLEIYSEMRDIRRDFIRECETRLEDAKNEGNKEKKAFFAAQLLSARADFLGWELGVALDQWRQMEPESRQKAEEIRARAFAEYDLAQRECAPLLESEEFHEISAKAKFAKAEYLLKTSRLEDAITWIQSILDEHPRSSAAKMLKAEGSLTRKLGIIDQDGKLNPNIDQAELIEATKTAMAQLNKDSGGMASGCFAGTGAVAAVSIVAGDKASGAALIAGCMTGIAVSRAGLLHQRWDEISFSYRTGYEQVTAMEAAQEAGKFALHLFSIYLTGEISGLFEKATRTLLTGAGRLLTNELQAMDVTISPWMRTAARVTFREAPFIPASIAMHRLGKKFDSLVHPEAPQAPDRFEDYLFSYLYLRFPQVFQKANPANALVRGNQSLDLATRKAINTVLANGTIQLAESALHRDFHNFGGKLLRTSLDLYLLHKGREAIESGIPFAPISSLASMINEATLENLRAIHESLHQGPPNDGGGWSGMQPAYAYATVRSGQNHRNAARDFFNIHPLYPTSMMSHVAPIEELQNSALAGDKSAAKQLGKEAKNDGDILDFLIELKEVDGETAAAGLVEAAIENPKAFLVLNNIQPTQVENIFRALSERSRTNARSLRCMHVLATGEANPFQERAKNFLQLINPKHYEDLARGHDDTKRKEAQETLALLAGLPIGNPRATAAVQRFAKTEEKGAATPPAAIQSTALNGKQPIDSVTALNGQDSAPSPLEKLHAKINATVKKASKGLTAAAKEIDAFASEIEALSKEDQKTLLDRQTELLVKELDRDTAEAEKNQDEGFILKETTEARKRAVMLLLSYQAKEGRHWVRTQRKATGDKGTESIGNILYQLQEADPDNPDQVNSLSLQMYRASNKLARQRAQKAQTAAAIADIDRTVVAKRDIARPKVDAPKKSPAFDAIERRLDGLWKLQTTTFVKSGKKNKGKPSDQISKLFQEINEILPLLTQDEILLLANHHTAGWQEAAWPISDIERSSVTELNRHTRLQEQIVAILLTHLNAEQRDIWKTTWKHSRLGRMQKEIENSALLTSEKTRLNVIDYILKVSGEVPRPTVDTSQAAAKHIEGPSKGKDQPPLEKIKEILQERKLGYTQGIRLAVEMAKLNPDELMELADEQAYLIEKVLLEEKQAKDHVNRTKSSLVKSTKEGDQYVKASRVLSMILGQMSPEVEAEWENLWSGSLLASSPKFSGTLLKELKSYAKGDEGQDGIPHSPQKTDIASPIAVARNHILEIIESYVLQGSTDIQEIKAEITVASPQTRVEILDALLAIRRFDDGASSAEAEDTPIITRSKEVTHWLYTQGVKNEPHQATLTKAIVEHLLAHEAKVQRIRALARKFGSGPGIDNLLGSRN